MSKNKNKITMDMTGVQAMTVLSEGIIGAVNVLAMVARDEHRFDPDAAGPFGVFLHLDDLGIYGSRLWQLYKDVCGSKLGVMLGVLRAHQLGLVSETELNEHIGDDLRRGKPFEDIDGILAEVKGVLPRFTETGVAA